jgi:O-acetyl-ADP-ribose deacetylase (regulator of RNase III)
MITEIEHDLLTYDKVDVIAHCANCFCTMNSGIAKKIRTYLPEAYSADCLTKTGDKNKFGSFSFAKITKPNIKTNIKYVYNLYGQYYYGRDSRKLNYESIYTAIESMSKDLYLKDIKSIGFPKNMGCVLAGGNWKIVFSIIETIFNETPFDVTICSYNI